MAKKQLQVIQLTEAPEIRFGDRLRVLRRALHLDQDAMGELLGVDGGRYGNWEAGSAKPRDLVATGAGPRRQNELSRISRLAAWDQNWKLFETRDLERRAHRIRLAKG